MARRRPRGFSLIEVTIVTGIIAVITGLSIAAYRQVGFASAPQNAINDLTSYLTRARNRAIEVRGRAQSPLQVYRAIERQTDVWVIFYPEYKKTSPVAATGGPGAYFIFEDRRLTFNRSSGGVATEVYYQTGAGGIAFDPVAGTLSGTTNIEGALIEAVYLDDYAGRNVSLALPDGGVTMGVNDVPFNGLTVGSACTFCSGIVFAPDGSARFVDGAGGAVAASGATSLARAHAVTVKNTTDTRVYVVAVSGPTAYVGMYDKR